MLFSEWIKTQLDALRALVGADGVEDTPATIINHAPSVQEIRTEKKLHLKFPTDPANVSPVRRLIEHFCTEAGLDVRAREEVGLVVNEALANIIRHAYSGANDKPVEATVEKIPAGVKITLRDWGNGINPGTLPRPEHDPLVPGGLGLICIHRLMDHVSYEPQSTGMQLVMTRTTNGSKSYPDDRTEFA